MGIFNMVKNVPNQKIRHTIVTDILALVFFLSILQMLLAIHSGLALGLGLPVVCGFFFVISGN